MYDESLPRVKRSYTLTFEQCVNHIATTPTYDRILRRAYTECLTPPPGPMCIVGETGCICNDPTADPQDYELSFPNCVNFVVTTPQYFRVIRDWYARKCE